MEKSQLTPWKHSHSFGQDKKRPGESRTLIVIGITFIMMTVEIVAGILYGSMALLADGLHMASHTVALSINAYAYIYARTHAHDKRFSFGTGKVNTLGGYTGAVILAGFALLMAWESVARLVNPVSIGYNQAILVAVLGLAVNGVSVLILGAHSHDGHSRNDHSHDSHSHEHHSHAGSDKHKHHHDHNLVSAYLHVLADALTSVLAIVALLAAKYYGLVWMDPLMGIIGAALVARWSLGLLKSTSAILLDHQGPSGTRARIAESIESGDTCRIVDLHLWAVGPNIYCAAISIVSKAPATPERYKSMLPRDIRLDHITIEVHPYEENP